MQKNVEIEMKLVVGKKALKDLLASQLLQQVVRPESEQQRHLVSTYYDTRELSLKKAGIAYRVRDKGDGSWEATVKTAQKSSSGLSQRLELNLPLQENKPVLEGFAALGLDYELTKLAPEGVEVLFTVEVDRTTYLLDLAGAVVELAIDRGKITSPRQKKAKDTIEEIELELLEGDLAPLLGFVAELTELVPVFVEKRSKFARGLALLGLASDAKADRVKVDMQENVRQQVLQLVQQRGDTLLLLQNELLQQEDEEKVKNLQKQLQYLRSYLALGAELAPSAQLEKVLTVAGEISSVAEAYLRLAELEEMWREIRNQADATLQNNVLSKKIVTEKTTAQTQIQTLAQEGKLSRLVYQAVAWLAVEAWQNEEYLEMASLARCRLKAWQETAEEAKEAEVALLQLQNSYCLAKTLPGKAFAKLAAEAKKARKKEQELVAKQALLQLLQQFSHGSNSRILTRDVGVVMGWLWAAK